MMWLVGVVVIIFFVLVWRKRLHGGDRIEKSNGQHHVLLSSIVVDVVDAEEDYLIAVMTAAIYEFAGTKDFKVVKITPSSEKWTLTGRQDLVSKR